MKTFGVYQRSLDSRPYIIRVRAGNKIEAFDYARKMQADKKIMSLLASGYKFDATHETLEEPHR